MKCVQRYSQEFAQNADNRIQELLAKHAKEDAERVALIRRIDLSRQQPNDLNPSDYELLGDIRAYLQGDV